MNQNIHRINDIIKQVPDLKYDASTGWFETDRRALYDFAQLIVRECANAIDSDDRLNDVRSAARGCVRTIKEHFGVEE